MKDIPAPPAAKVTLVPNSQLPMYGKSTGGGAFQLSSDVGRLFGKTQQTADIFVSRVQVWTGKDGRKKKESAVVQGLRVFYKDSQDNEVPTGVAGQDKGTYCEILIPKNAKVGSVDVRSGDWIYYIEIRDTKGKSLGSCGNSGGGDLSSVIIHSDEIFNGLFGNAGVRVDKIGVQKATLVSYV